MLNIVKDLYNDERNFKYTCLCHTFNLKRNFDKLSNSYIDNIKNDGAECLQGHMPHTNHKNKYDTNSIGLRSDELRVVDYGTHVLFGGCSQTFGYGINEKESLWSYIVNKNFDDSSGYFNVARNGWNISQVVLDSIVYCNSYGMPKYMFLLLPDIERESVNFKMTTKDKLNSTEKEYINLLQKRSAFISLLAVENFCSANSIKLVYSTWSGPTAKLFSTWKLKNYMPIVNFDDVSSDESIFFFTDLQPDRHWKKHHNQKFAELILENIK